MSTDKPVTGEIVWSRVDWPEDSYITDGVISESVKARAELVAATSACRAARTDEPAHRFDEAEMSDCAFGCKVFRCPCGHPEVRHMASYGCPVGRAELAGAR